MQTLLKKIITSEYGQVIAVGDIKTASKEMNERKFQMALIDLMLPDGSGLSLLKHIKEIEPDCKCILMTGYGTIRTAVEAINYGAYDYLEKPFNSMEELRGLIQNAVKSTDLNTTKANEFECISYYANQVGMLISNYEKMQQLLYTAYRIANKKISVLITGETGTGKELLARFIHLASNRSENYFTSINCGAIHENLLESELFGHEKGAFTGSVAAKKGIFELADQGTLFLDELGEASQAIQVKLLRVLESGEFMRVGGEKLIQTDVRVIAATNSDLEELIERKNFRKDLYYRLNVVHLDILPLRKRVEDIPQLINFFVDSIVSKYDLSTNLVFSELALEVLKLYPWHGNIRELYNITQQIVLQVETDVIEIKHLPRQIISTVNRNEDKEKVMVGHNIKSNGDDEENFNPKPLKDVEKEYIEKTINYFDGNLSMAAKALGISRATLYRKVK
ncbi:MAG: sigma-54-dependent Fis family transcriptional regulator [Firmicutes bacterium]|nr:sigma-54-dependent Fis family transcriptional regulator [Bacillota bacterium]